MNTWTDISSNYRPDNTTNTQMKLISEEMDLFVAIVIVGFDDCWIRSIECRILALKERQKVVEYVH